MTERTLYHHFEQWYKSQEKRFRTGQFSCEEEALSAFLEGVEYYKKLFIELMEKCADYGCVVIPVKLYSDWGDDGNIDESKFEGVYYTVLESSSLYAVGQDYWIMIDDSQEGRENYYKTPQEAFSAFLEGVEYGMKKQGKS